MAVASWLPWLPESVYLHLRAQSLPVIERIGKLLHVWHSLGTVVCSVSVGVEDRSQLLVRQAHL